MGDNSYAVLDLLHCCQSLRQPVALIARLRLDAALYAPAPARQPGQNGRQALKGPRRPPLKTLLDHANVTWANSEVAWYDGTTRTVELSSQTAVWYRSGKLPVTIRWVLIRDPQGTFDPQALLCTDPSADPAQILEWFVLRWQLEVTFQEVRTHLGVEIQRQWSDRAIARTTPALLGLFSWTTLAAHALQKRHPMTQRRAAWYDKPSPTLRGRHRPGATPPVAGVRRFFTVRSQLRYAGTPSRPVPPACRFPRLRRLKCVKPSLDDSSWEAAHAYECARDQGVHDGFHDLAFKQHLNPEGTNFSPEGLSRMAAVAGADSKNLRQLHVAGPPHQDKVKLDHSRGAASSAYQARPRCSWVARH